MHDGPFILATGHLSYTPPREFDLASAPDAMAELKHLLEIHPRIAVDLSKIEFIDSAGLSALVWANQLASDADGAVVLYGVSRRVMRLLQLTHLDSVFRVYPNAESIPGSIVEDSAGFDLV